MHDGYYYKCIDSVQVHARRAWRKAWSEKKINIKYNESRPDGGGLISTVTERAAIRAGDEMTVFRFFFYSSLDAFRSVTNLLCVAASDKSQYHHTTIIIVIVARVHTHTYAHAFVYIYLIHHIIIIISTLSQTTRPSVSLSLSLSQSLGRRCPITFVCSPSRVVHNLTILYYTTIII